MTLASVMLVAAPAASALASARLRLVNAHGGTAATLTVSVAGKRSTGAAGVSFGQAGGLLTVPPGQARVTVAGKSTTKRLADGASYTVVALPRGAPEILHNGSAVARQARLRIVHAAPELGSPDVRLGKRTIAQGLKFRGVTGYLTVDPGAYKLGVAKPNGGATVFQRSVALAAGTATTVVLAGSGGNPERIVAANDDTVTPRGAPHTGLGGLARGGGAPWLPALLAALVAGTLGGTLRLRRTRRAGR